MLVTNNKPTDWRMLQDYVAKYFNEAGYEAVTSKTVDLVRGKAETDVYVLDNRGVGKKILCECKYWGSNIPQEKIHAFRTIVADAGANLGLFITTSNFQSGAKSAALCSNIELLTWEGFLELIRERWVINRFLNLCEKARPLSVYTDPFDIDSDNLTKEQLKLYNMEVENHIPMLMIYHPFRIYFMGKSEVEYNVVNEHLETVIDGFNRNGFNFLCFEDFFEFSENELRKSISFFENLFGDYIKELNKKIY